MTIKHWANFKRIRLYKDYNLLPLTSSVKSCTLKLLQIEMIKKN